VISDVIDSGGAALLALHELAPARGILDRTITLSAGRIATGNPEREFFDRAVVGSV
jgi:ABC-type polar amino acid transport system ATPase subunit